MVDHRTQEVAKAIAKADDAGDVDAIWRNAGIHSGDCTKEAHTCLRCQVLHYEMLARAATASILAQITPVPPPVDSEPSEHFESGWRQGQLVLLSELREESDAG